MKQMTKKALVAASSAALLMALVGCGNNADEQTQAAAERAEQRLEDSPRMSSSGIDVEPQEQSGSVALQGEVGSESERRQAEQIAQGTPGVESVENQLEIDRPGIDAREGTEERPLASADSEGTVRN